MSWQCNYCGHRTEPVREVKQDGEDWPAGRACSKCGVGEIVHRPEQTVCEECRGDGVVRVGERLVSREMAADAGDRSLEVLSSNDPSYPGIWKLGTNKKHLWLAVPRDIALRILVLGELP